MLVKEWCQVSHPLLLLNILLPIYTMHSPDHCSHTTSVSDCLLCKMPLVKLTHASAAKFMPAASKAATTIEMAVLEPSGCCHRPRLTHAATKLAGTAAPLAAPEDPPYPSMPLTFKLKRFCALFFSGKCPLFFSLFLVFFRSFPAFF